MGEVSQAITSIMSDLGKHSELIDVADACTPLALVAMTCGDPREVRRFIEGFR
jgi:hypothetical protein